MLIFFSQKDDRISWAIFLWSKSNIPQHSFTLWLTFLDCLHIRERLFEWSIINSNECLLCNNIRENVSYLLFNCAFYEALRRRVLKALDVSISPLCWTKEVSWSQKRLKDKPLILRMREVLFSSIVYMIWNPWNVMLFQQQHYSYNEVYSQIRGIMLLKYKRQLHCQSGKVVM